MNNKELSDRDICTTCITPAVKQAGWDEMPQIREDVGFTKGQIIVRGKLLNLDELAESPAIAEWEQAE